MAHLKEYRSSDYFLFILINLFKQDLDIIELLYSSIIISYNFSKKITTMSHRPSHSLANLRTSISKQMAQFKTIQLTHSRKVCCQNDKKPSSLSKRGQRIFNKSVASSSKSEKKANPSKKGGQLANISMNKSTFLSIKNQTHQKKPSKLKKKGYIFAKPAIPAE